MDEKNAPACGCRLEVIDDGIKLITCDESHVIVIVGGHIIIDDLMKFKVSMDHIREWFNRHKNPVAPSRVGFWEIVDGW